MMLQCFEKKHIQWLVRSVRTYNFPVQPSSPINLSKSFFSLPLSPFDVKKTFQKINFKQIIQDNIFEYFSSQNLTK